MNVVNVQDQGSSVVTEFVSADGNVKLGIASYQSGANFWLELNQYQTLRDSFGPPSVLAFRAINSAFGKKTWTKTIDAFIDVVTDGTTTITQYIVRLSWTDRRTAENPHAVGDVAAECYRKS